MKKQTLQEVANNMGGYASLNQVARIGTMKLREALEKSLEKRVSIGCQSFEINKVGFTEEELETEMKISTNLDIETGKPYQVANCIIDNNEINILLS